MLQVSIRVRPGVSKPGVGGSVDGRLVVRVSTPAVDGRATEAALRALAEAFGVRRAHVQLVTGATMRDKSVRIEGEQALLEARLGFLLGL